MKRLLPDCALSIRPADPGNVEFARAKDYATKGFRAAERGVNRHWNLRRAMGASVTESRSGLSTVSFTNGPTRGISTILYILRKVAFKSKWDSKDGGETPPSNH